MKYESPRDFIGYGQNPPDPKWPGGARVALNIVLNYEEGAEYSVLEGDDNCDLALTEVTGYDPQISGRDLAAESMFEYGSRVGVWRVVRALQERQLPLTVFGTAVALERNPAFSEVIAEKGYDVCCHGWRWVNQYDLSEDQEREHIRHAVASLEKSVGERPYGWYCRYGPSVNTRRLLVEEGGFLYDSNTYNDELPYWTQVEGKHHLVVPYLMTSNDGKFGMGIFSNSDEFYTYLKDSFDVLYREGETQPKTMTVGLHSRLVGHPGRIVGLERFLDYVLGHENVWICRRLDIARHWFQHHIG